jgi:1,2-phenylacetyl-CoA epoxidase PaaB subunit
VSKAREHIPVTDGDLTTPPEGDLAPWVIFTQLKAGGAYVYAGWLDAIDAAMALQFAREHYGQDQECVSIRAIPRTAITGTEPEYAARQSAGGVTKRAWVVFAQKRSGDPYVSTGTVEATGAAAALEAARKSARGAPSSLWVVPEEAIATTSEGDVIWRLTDRTYRLARGYSALVREKWHKVRSDRDLSEYEKDDLKDCF